MESAGAEPDQAHRVTGLTGRGHRTRRPRVRIGAVVGTAAAVVAVTLGTAMLIRGPSREHEAHTDPTAERITLSAPATVPLTGPQILELIGQRPDYGVLQDPQRRSSCLAGLGYPASVTVLGAKPVDVAGRPAVVLVIPGDTAEVVNAVVVPQSCTSADTALIAETKVTRP